MDLTWQKNKVLYTLIGLIIIRVILVLLTVNNIFPDISIQKDIWMPNIDWAGDKEVYFLDAQKILAADFKLSWGFGFPLFLTPFVKLFGQTDINQIIKPVTIFNTVIFYSLAIILVYMLARKVLNSRNKALVISSLFVIYPYLFYFFFNALASTSSVINHWYVDRFTHLIFLGPISDFLAMNLVIITLLLLIYLLTCRKTLIGHSLLLGFLVSYAVATRLQNGFLLPIYSVLLLGHRKFKSFFYFLLGGVFLAVGQLYLNYLSYGSVFKTTYGLYKGQAKDIPMFSVFYPLRVFTYPYNYSKILFVLTLLVLVVLILGVIYLIKKNRRIAIIAATYFICYSGFLLFLEPVMRGPRYFLPVIPLFFIFIYAGLDYLYQLIKKYVSRSSA